MKVFVFFLSYSLAINLFFVSGISCLNIKPILPSLEKEDFGNRK